MYAVCAAAVSKAKNEVSILLHGLVLSMRHCLETFIAHGRNSVSERILIVVMTFCIVKKELRDVVSGQSVLHVSLFDVTEVILVRDVLLLPEVHAKPNGDCTHVQSFEEI